MAQHRSDAPVPRAHLPALTADEARARGLATPAQVARAVGASESAVLRHLRTPDAPAAVARLVTSRGARPLLYELSQVTAHLAAASPQMRNRLRRAADGLATLEASGDEALVEPVLVRLRTPTAGRGYVWRDPRRWPDRAAARAS